MSRLNELKSCANATERDCMLSAKFHSGKLKLSKQIETSSPSSQLIVYTFIILSHRIVFNSMYDLVFFDVVLFEDNEWLLYGISAQKG